MSDKQGIAKILGDTVYDKPEKLFIPPNALEVILEAFEGPLDFLLYIIEKQKLDICDLPIFEITEQYMEYVDLMIDMDIEIAADYMVMAATLADIKSRMILPVTPIAEEEEEDPRAALVQRLQEYEKIKKASEQLDSLPRVDRDFFFGKASPHPECKAQVKLPDVSPSDLAGALKDILLRAKQNQDHTIKREELSTRERMTLVLDRLSKTNEQVEFSEFFRPSEGVSGVVVAFLAILELTKERFIELVQFHEFGVIYVKKAGDVTADMERLLV